MKGTNEMKELGTGAGGPRETPVKRLFWRCCCGCPTVAIRVGWSQAELAFRVDYGLISVR